MDENACSVHMDIFFVSRSLLIIAKHVLRFQRGYRFGGHVLVFWISARGQSR
jgi:hypothetical protein